MRWIAFALLLCACSSSRSYSTGEQSEEELQEILNRREVLESALALPDAVYLIPRDDLTAERGSLLGALAKAEPDRETPPFRVAVESNRGVKAYPRAEVLEIAFEDGMLHVTRDPDGAVSVAFEQGNLVRFMDLLPSSAVDAAWRAHAAAARTKSKRIDGLGWSERPLQRLRDVGITNR